MTRPTGRSEQHDDDLTLQEVADLLNVHYMTVYRYVRIGRLAAERRGKQWYVARSSLEAMRAPNLPGRRGTATRSSPHRDYADELASLLLAGDEAEAWRLLQAALASAFSVEALYSDVVAAAMRVVGDGWASGRIGVDEEHRASAITSRLIGRLGPSFTRSGPTRGLIVLGTPSGDRHGMTTALLADPLRGRGFSVADLGGDTPGASFAATVKREARTMAVGIAVSSAIRDEVLATTIGAIRGVRHVPILIGGSGISDTEHATRVGADAFSDSSSTALAWFESIAAAIE